MTTIAVPLTDNTENKLSDFTIRDKLGAAVIALDAEKKQLMFLTKKSQTASCLIIDLNKLSGCSVTKEYDSIKAGALKQNKLHRFLKSIFLNLRLGTGPVMLSVYNERHDLNADVKLLESKAKKWQNIVSKFIRDKVHKNRI